MLTFLRLLVRLAHICRVAIAFLIVVEDSLLIPQCSVKHPGNGTHVPLKPANTRGRTRGGPRSLAQA
eukprot:1358236-Pleurochrysis_carterae.AAC.1